MLSNVERIIALSLGYVIPVDATVSVLDRSASRIEESLVIANALSLLVEPQDVSTVKASPANTSRTVLVWHDAGKMFL